MAKKRKGSSRAQESFQPDLDVGSSTKRIRTYEDVADSDDEFHDSRDKLLLEEGPEAKRQRRVAEEEEFLEPSDEEVLGYSEDDEEYDDNNKEQAPVRSRRSRVEPNESGDEDDQEEEFTWGTSKADLYGADAIETEEQALEEEAEALRLQKKQLQAMTAADYGFDETEWQEAGKAEKAKATKDSDVVTEVLPQLQIPENMSNEDKTKLLTSRYPEFVPLSQELVRMEEVVGRLRQDAKDAGPNVVTKSRAASAYLGALAMYFTMLVSPSAGSQDHRACLAPTQLREHPLMSTLVECRALWQKVEALPDVEEVVDDSGIGSSAAEVMDPVESAGPAKLRSSEKPAKLSRAQKHAQAAQAAAQAKQAARLKRTEAGLADLDELVNTAGGKRKTKAPKFDIANGDGSDIGEEAPLTAQEAAEKAKRKKSLRFYTSQIAQKANKRGASGRSAGGDEDIPHRERLRDRQVRLNAEAEKRGRKRDDAGAELGGASDEEDAKASRQIRAEVEDNEYYDLVAARTAKKKSDKAALVEAQKQAAQQGGRVVEEETVQADGKRKITYAIEKNKGLTPFRKKDVRNPRVKKRKKYDEKKKKLASMKPVYKGGEPRGGYGGELTGIKTGLVKSTKF